MPGNSYYQAAYDESTILEVVAREGCKTFRELVAKLSADGTSLQEVAETLGLSPQRFTAYHAKWMAANGEPLDLEGV